ncbi:MAG: type II secretion system inner membrane protein GspF [Alphaproteobacteria bacterium]|nr:type II secretion system inner membrane protein GspF [Alphaproteobacteria bacterium]HPF46801.1 type II secretion system inner membrane protein GspF [Emcibacteraceae bacterium]
MPAYNYEALDSSGQTRKGVIAADSLRDARQKLRAISLFPVDIKQGKDKDRYSIAGLSLSKHKAISSKDLTLLTRQMATMFSAGTPIEEALGALSKQCEKAVLRNILTKIRAQVSEGSKLSDAMKSESASFPALYRAMIAAGEASGNLGPVMERIADYSEKSQDIKNKVSTALIYPIVLSVVATAVLVILMTFVVPKVVSQFENIGAELPGLTRVVMAISSFLVNYGLFLLIGLIGFITLFISLGRRKSVRLKIHGVLLKLPFVGRLILSVSSARFARTMGTLIDGGSPVLESIRAAKETVSNEVIREAIETVYLNVREGHSLSFAMKRTGVFAPLLIYMCSMGEKSGRLSYMLVKIADYLEAEFEGISQKALSLLEPMIVIIMGLMVGLIVMSIMLPIMRLNSLILM